MVPRHSRKPFAPWKAEFRVAAFYWMVGAFWLAAALLWCIREPSLAAEEAAEAAVLPFFLGLLRVESGRRRKYGIQIEKKWAGRFLAAVPPDVAVEYDVELKTLGNVDLLVRFANGQICPIEIKSWRNTGFRLRFDKALRQVQRQRDALRAQNGVLWLPEAKVRYAGTQGDIVVVQGDERFLIECLRKLSYRFVVRFPQAPSQVLCAQLRELQLYWNQRDECWEGRGPSPGSIPFGRKSRPRAGP